jgi:hypothetical protein
MDNYKIRKESFEDQRKAGRWNPSLEITFRDRTGTHTHKLSAGYQDDIYVYRQASETFVLTKNEYLGYIGLEVFNGAVKVFDIFIEDFNVPDTIGSFDLAPFTIIRRLEPYMAC